MTDVCAIHANHTPRNLTLESHHLIPRAWQAVWRPADDKRVVWAPKTIELCPTGHRNVHQILVAVMHEFQAVTTFTDENDRLATAITVARREFGRLKEFDIAISSPRQWITRGGALDVLIADKQYGFGMAGFATGGIFPTRYEL